MNSSIIEAKIQKRTAVFGAVGLGYVGLPLAREAARAGFKVIGLDKDGERCAGLNSGISHVEDVFHEDLRELLSKGSFRATDDFSALAGCDVIAVCVPTPLTPTKDPDLSYVRDAGQKIAEVLSKHKGGPRLVILESTSYPGTTDEVMMPFFSNAGLVLDEDVFLAFSPERIDPGSQKWTVSNTPKLVGGTSQQSGELAALFYEQFIDKVVLLSCAKAAEMAKLLENIFRAVNIALVNELWILCDRMGLNVWEVIEAASTKPFGYMTFWPGPGLGGHCIPVDPFYLAWKAREYDFHTEFIELAGKVNVNMPHFVTGKLASVLNQEGKSLKGSRVVVLGVSYKADVGDTRESPAFKVMELLNEQGVDLIYHDPFVPCFEVAGQLYESQEMTSELLTSSDCVLVLTAHSTVDYELVREAGIPVLDTRNVVDPVGI